MLDEAIEYHATSAKAAKKRGDDVKQRYHDQLNEWLVELKARRGTVDHPNHYTACGGVVEEDGLPVYETIKVIERLGLARGFCLGNAVKYMLRARHKGSELQDLMKARWYLKRFAGRSGPSRGLPAQHDVDTGHAARVWQLSSALTTALAHVQGGCLVYAIEFVEAELDERFPGWHTEV